MSFLLEAAVRWVEGMCPGLCQPLSQPQGCSAVLQLTGKKDLNDLLLLFDYRKMVPGEAFHTGAQN
jgi:hypothetical protein